MADSATARKLPDERAFRDLSDYARPLAVRIARGLKNTPVTAPLVTLVWTPIGLGGALCYAAGGYGLALVGTVALQVKNILDAVDGSLARLQGRPSRIGRFLDTDMDAVVAAALYAGLAMAVADQEPRAYTAALAAAALLLGLLQGSVYNYYYVLYRSRSGGDTTSRIREGLTREDRNRYGERGAALALLRALIAFYNGFYGWQDDLVRWLDRWAARPLVEVGLTERAARLRDDRRFLSAASALGPGFQILVLNLLTLWGWVSGRLDQALELFLWTVAVGGTVYAGLLIVGLRVAGSRLEARSQSE